MATDSVPLTIRASICRCRAVEVFPQYAALPCMLQQIVAARRWRRQPLLLLLLVFSFFFFLLFYFSFSFAEYAEFAADFDCRRPPHISCFIDFSLSIQVCGATIGNRPRNLAWCRYRLYGHLSGISYRGRF